MITLPFAARNDDSGSWTGRSGAKPPGDINKSEIRDDRAAVFQKYILALEILVNNASVMQIAHTLGNLLRYYDNFVHRKFVPYQMKCCVKRVSCKMNKIGVSNAHIFFTPSNNDLEP